MKRILFALMMTAIGFLPVSAQTKYVLSASTCSSASSAASPWSFSNGFTVSNASGKTLSFANGSIKYSAAVQYTVTLPDGVSVKYITLSGYDNYGDDAYLSELCGQSYAATDYVFPGCDVDDSGKKSNFRTVSFDFTPETDIEGSFTFTIGGKQTVLTITLYDYIPNSGSTSAADFSYPTPASQMETLTRGLVAVPANGGTGEFVSWRYFGTDAAGTTFDLYRDGVLIAEDLSVTNYTDTEGTSTSQYYVVTKADGSETDTSGNVTPWSNIYKTLTLDLPTAETSGVTYSPNDMSVGDVDGDGEFELVVKWDPSNSQDNSIKGKTDKVYLDAYKTDGTKLWRIDLGHNIRAGAHYTQFLVWDFDGNGKAELICKTAPGTVDGKGNYVTAAADDSDIQSADNTADYRNSNGYVLSGPEYLTVFDGTTGAALHTIYYNPNRAGGTGGSASLTASVWKDVNGKSDSYGGRADRFLATVAYLGGTDANPSAVMTRGYYGAAYLWAVDFDGSKLSTRWLHNSPYGGTTVNVTDASGNVTTTTYSSSTSGLTKTCTAFGCGNHNLSCGDVDGDGCDEIVWGSCAIDHDGSLMYSTGYGHGDAIHLGDLNPDRAGLEVFEVHEESYAGYGWDLHDAATGEILLSATGSADNGRGLAADQVRSSRGYEFCSSNDRTQRSAVTGDTVATKSTAVNFRIYWSGEPYDGTFDGKYSSSDAKAYPVIQMLNEGATSNQTLVTFSNYGNWQSCNTTKATPCFQGDILGDWREEVILWNYDNHAEIAIFTTNLPTEYTVPTLLHDHVYRLGLAWQNAGYNQPPHLGYYLPDYIASKESTGIRGVAGDVKVRESSAVYDLQGRRLAAVPAKGVYIQGGRKIVR